MPSTHSIAAGKLDEVSLREELKTLRAQVPDLPSLNPIALAAFNLSRRLEAGEISFDELKALAVRLMDNACVHRALRLREQLSLVDDASTHAEFRKYIADAAQEDQKMVNGFEQFKKRWSRARTGVVLTAHPTFGLSEALSNRMAEIAVSGTDKGHKIGLAHRPDASLTLEHEHKRAEDAIRNLRDAYVDLMGDFFSVSANAFGDQAYKAQPELTTFASWVGYDLDGRTDIKWSFSFLVRLKEKFDGLTDIRERFLAIRPNLGESAEITRLTRQITGKLDLAISAVIAQMKGVDGVIAGTTKLADAANIVTQADTYNLVSAEPLIEILEQIIDTVIGGKEKAAVASLVGLLRATGLGMSHIHLRVNAVQVNNAFRAFVHESWTHDLTERQALGRIVELIKNAKPESVNFETLQLENATAIRQFALAAQIYKHVDRDTPIRYLIAECESPATMLIAVYFAKLFGVADIVDISPLFETPAALETGPRLIERLLAEDDYRDYVKKRGRISRPDGLFRRRPLHRPDRGRPVHERLQHGLAEVVAKANFLASRC